MKLLTFLASSFAWTPHTRSLSSAEEAPGPRRVEDAVVVFFQAEEEDQEEAARRRALRHTLKHVKWLANKRGFRRIVLHSFGHLSSRKADPQFAREFQADLAQRLASVDYEVTGTPFGWSCGWDLSVEGESLAKVWKEI